MSSPKLLDSLRRKVIASVLGVWLGAFSAVASNGPRDTPEISVSNALPLVELRNSVSKNGRSIQSFTVRGVVCAVDQGRNRLTIQDDSACAILEVPRIDSGIQIGDLIEIAGKNCALTRSRFGAQVGTAPIVNNDGHHRAVPKSGKVFLEAGLQPIRVSWFNGYGLSALRVEYEGPGVPRQAIPARALFRENKTESAAASCEPGLDFAAYTGNWLFTLPDFGGLTPVARGVATNFDLRHSARAENAGLVFSGLLKIDLPGLYTFYVDSDDGCYLYVGRPDLCTRITVLGHKTAPTDLTYSAALATGEAKAWTIVDGEVVFVGQNEDDVELELSEKGGQRLQATVIDGSGLVRNNLLHRQVRAMGILEARPDTERRAVGRLVVPGPEQIQIGEIAEVANSRSPSPAQLLTSVGRIRRLPRSEAARGLSARVRGVVIWSSHEACVLEDDTGGVFIHYTADDWTDEPRAGEAWEMEGKTDPGDFSPVMYASKATFLGQAAMPEPIRPTGDQLMNGSLDAEYVELRGALTEISEQQLTLLTAEGKLNIAFADDRPLPRLPEPGPGVSSVVDSIVRIRGCFTVRWDSKTRQILAGLCFLGPAAVEIEEFAPTNPFSLATRTTADLLRFDPGASALQRTKLKGRIIFGKDRQFCLEDGESGLRLQTKESMALPPGSIVEAVGFPQVGGPSPVLVEARVRMIGRLPLPTPTRLPAAELLNRGHDSTLVQIEAALVQDRRERGERVLELQAGQTHFTARLEEGPYHATPLEAGSRLLVSGVYLSQPPEQAGGSLDAFELGLSDPGEITILERPPWWTLERAGAVLSVLGVGLGAALVWITALRRKVEERTRQLQTQIEQRQVVEQRRVMEQERTRVAQDLHDELGAGLTEVGLLGDLVKSPGVPDPEKHRYLGQLTDIARSLVSSLDEIVWAINPHYDSVASLASYYTLFAQRFLNLAGVACRPEIPPSFPEYPLDSKERHDLFLAFREALNNVVRHSGATEVRLTIGVDQGELVVSVADNGRGFGGMSERPGADGLTGMRRRLEDLGGSCDIRSRLGEGTVVELRLPIRTQTLTA